MMRPIQPGLVAIALMFTGAAANAQSYTRAASTKTFQSIAGTGTALSLTDNDEGYGTLSAPFSFNLYGTPFAAGSTLYVSSNGTLHLDSQVSNYNNVAIPLTSVPNQFLAPFWDDLDFLSGGVFYQTTGTTGSRVLVIEWNNAGNYNATSDTFSFQLRIYEGTNVIEFDYGPRSVVGAWDGTIGIEDASGSVGASEICTPSCTPADVASNTAITLTPGGGGGQSDFTVSYVSTPPTSAQENGSFSLDVEVDNNGSVASPAGDVGLFIGSSPTVTASDYNLGYGTFSSIASGSYYFGTLSISIPSGYAGTWYMAVIADPYNSVVESSESNNTYPLGTITITGVSSSITVTTTTLPGGSIGTSYSAQLQQSGASSPYWSIISGSLPPGLTLYSSGLISGSPSGSGLYSFRVQAEQVDFIPGTADLTINVGGGGGISITTTSLPAGTVGVPYQGLLQATGGLPPYAFQIISGRPEWLTLDSSGNLSGTPDQQGSHQLTISVFDSNSADASATLSLEVQEPQTLSIAGEIPAGVTNRAYDQRVVVGGVPPYQTNVVSGTLPPGLAIDVTGQLAGLPAEGGDYTFTLETTDSNQGSAQGTLHLTITELTNLEVKDKEVLIYVNSDVDTTLMAKGGVPPYSWSVTAGELLPGLTFDASGHIGGRVDKVGNNTVTFTVSDSEGSVAEGEVAVRATVYRAPSSRGSDRRRGGCACVAPQAPNRRTGWLWFLLIGVGILARQAGARRVDRRRGPPRSATPH